MRKQQGRSSHIDPDPFSVAVGIVGIVGGLASILATYRTLVPQSPIRIRSRITDSLGPIGDEAKYLEANVEVFRTILREADLAHMPSSGIGQAVFLTDTQFDRYARVTDNIMRRLRTLLRQTNRLERLFARLPAAESLPISDELTGIRQHVNRLLASSDRPIDRFLYDLESLIKILHDAVAELRSNRDPLMPT